jgi:threonine dehydratase
MDPHPTRADIARVHEIIGPCIRHTPILSANGSEIGCEPFPLTLKLELLQHSGSFKVRGAFANLLTRPIPPSGVAAASGGNHGVAVAYAANRLGVPATIFVPTVSAPSKVEAIRGYGATVVVSGERYADALDESRRFTEESHALEIHAFDQAETLQGQGTLGRELEAQVPASSTVLVAVGGGGLIGGVASWYAGQGVRIVGVEPVEAPTLTEALKAGRPVDAPAGGIAVDSLAPRRVGDLTFSIAQRSVSRVVLVEDEEIVRGQQVLWDAFRILVEPGGAAAFAALLARRYEPSRDEHVVVVLCGGNVRGGPLSC